MSGKTLKEVIEKYGPLDSSPVIKFGPDGSISVDGKQQLDSMPTAIRLIFRANSFFNHTDTIMSRVKTLDSTRKINFVFVRRNDGWEVQTDQIMEFPADNGAVAPQ
jgi:hypothetical protein